MNASTNLTPNMNSTLGTETKTKAAEGQVSPNGIDQTRSGFETSLGIDNISIEPNISIAMEPVADMHVQPGPPVQ